MTVISVMPIHFDLSKSNLENDQPAEKKAEIPAVLASEKGKNIFQKLSAGAKEFYLNLQEKADKSALRMKTLDKAQMMWNSRLLERHDKKTAELAGQIKRAEQDTGLLERAATSSASFLEDFKKKHPDYSGDLSKLEKEASGAKQDFQKRIEKIAKKKDDLETKLQYRNEKKAIYEEKRNIIVKEVSAKITDRLRPHENRMEGLRGKKEKLESEINDFANLKESFDKELMGLEADMGQANFRVERKMLKEAISLIKKELLSAEKNLEMRRNQKLAVENRLARVDKRANKWRDLRNAFVRVGERKVEYPPVSKKDETITRPAKVSSPVPIRGRMNAEAAEDIFEASEGNEEDVPLEESPIPESREESVPEVKDEPVEVIGDVEKKEVGEVEAGKEGPEKQEKMNVQFLLSDYLEAFNSLAGRNYRINQERLIKALNIPQDLLQTQINLETLEGFVRGYYSRLKESGEEKFFDGSGLKRKLKATAQKLGLK